MSKGKDLALDVLGQVVSYRSLVQAIEAQAALLSYIEKLEKVAGFAKMATSRVMLNEPEYLALESALTSLEEEQTK